MTSLSSSPLLSLLLPSCNATGMSCTCARGLIVVAIVRRNRYVVCSRTRPRRLTCRSSLPIVVVVVVFARRDRKMPCACARGLVVDIRHRHCRSCCHCCRRAMQRECEALSTTSSSSLPLFLSLSPLCDATCCRALAHEALSPLPLRDAMCQQLVRSCTLLLQYEARAHAHEGLW